MKVGNLVSIKRSHGRSPIVGVVIAIKEIAHVGNRALVEPLNGGRQILAHPIDMEVISDCR